MLAQIKEIIRKVDWALIAATLILTAIGFSAVASATSRFMSANVFIQKQLFAITLGVLCLIGFTLFNYRIIEEYYKPLYILSIFLLILTLLFGKEIRGTKAWLDFFGKFSIQTSEISKLLLLISAPSYISRNYQNPKSNNYIVLLLMFLSHIILIAVQKDFSGILIYFPLLLCCFYILKIRKGLMMLCLLSIAITVALTLLLLYASYIKDFEQNLITSVYNMLNERKEIFLLMLIIILIILWLVKYICKQMFIYIPTTSILLIWFAVTSCLMLSYTIANNLQGYQKKRLLTFIAPEVDKTGFGYSLTQSKIAIGSGRLFGKGLFSGTQTQLGFIPERHTDFIFAVISEELGFFVSSIVIGLYLLMMLRIYYTLSTTSDVFGSSMLFFIIVSISFSTIYNLGMNLGLLPVIGLNLPFLSYGGTAMVCSLAMIGLVQSIYVRRFLM